MNAEMVSKALYARGKQVDESLHLVFSAEKALDIKEMVAFARGIKEGLRIAGYVAYNVEKQEQDDLHEAALSNSD